jgi:hypothetical protein
MSIPLHSIVQEKNPEGFPRKYKLVGFSERKGLLITECDPPHRMGYAQEGDLDIVPLEE